MTIRDFQTNPTASVSFSWTDAEGKSQSAIVSFIAGGIPLDDAVAIFVDGLQIAEAEYVLGGAVIKQEVAAPINRSVERSNAMKELRKIRKEPKPPKEPDPVVVEPVPVAVEVQELDNQISVVKPKEKK